MNKNNDWHLAAIDDVNPDKFIGLKERLYQVPEDISDHEKNKRTISVYDYDDQKVITYSSQTVLELSKSMPNKDVNDEDSRQYYTYEYTPSPQFHMLHNVYLTLKFGEIKVMPEYHHRVQIRMCHNVMHNIVTNASLIFPYKDGISDGVYVHSVNTFLHDAYRIKDCINIQKYDYAIGNRKELTQWSNCLKTRDDLCLFLAFFMKDSEKFAIPIHMYNYPSNIKISITYCLALESLIQMRVLNGDNKWEVIKPDLRFLEKKNETEPLRELQTPRVWGQYRMLLEEEVAGQKDGYTILINDYRYYDDTETKKDFAIDITDEKYITRNIRYGFLNQKASIFNGHSNYTLNHKNVITGDDPQEDYSLSYGNVPRITKRSNAHSTIVPDHYHYISACDEKGIHDLTYDFFPYGIGPDTGVLLNKKSILACTLRTERIKRDQTNSNKSVLKAGTKSQNPDEILDNVLKIHHGQYPQHEMDASISEKFIFKGYCKFFRYLTFKVGTVVLHDS